MTTLALRHIDRRGAWILAGALAGALVMQAAIFTAAALRLNSVPDNGDVSVLLSRRHHFGDVLVAVGTNCAWLVAIALLAWPIARLWSWGLNDSWDHPKVNLAARFLYPSVAVALLGLLCWAFSRQAQILDRRLVSHWALLAMLPHGTLELGALLLPLAAAASCIFRPAERPGRLLLEALAVSVPLLVCAAFVEVYLTPHLLLPLQT